MHIVQCCHCTDKRISSKVNARKLGGDQKNGTVSRDKNQWSSDMITTIYRPADVDKEITFRIIVWKINYMEKV